MDLGQTVHLGLAIIHPLGIAVGIIRYRSSENNNFRALIAIIIAAGAITWLGVLFTMPGLVLQAFLRTVHIVFGAIWVGSAVFMALILEPRLRALGPAHQGPVMGAVAPAMGRVIGASATLTILTGIWLVQRLTYGPYLGSWDNWFGGRGYAILLGGISGVIAFGTGIATGVVANRMMEVGRSMGGPPTPEQAARLQEMSRRITMLGRATAVLLVIAVVAMVSARWFLW